MRLLECSNDKFSLTKDFSPRDIPSSYAIISHTWGADNEQVTYQDFINGGGQTKPGYDKIKSCAEQATRDGLGYFWVDTCCTDKSNRAELNEAINSMFSWYKSSTRCYVYLSDVSGSVYENEEPVNLALRASRWFTRGWTLQELLAPSSVEFYTKDGRRLGDKRSLERQIHEITGLGGVGKTQLALELAFRARAEYQDCSVVWIPVTSRESFSQAYLNAARQLGIPGCEGDKADIKKLVQAHLSSDAAGHWLLIFDNADDMSIWIDKSTTEYDRLLGLRYPVTASVLELFNRWQGQISSTSA